MRVVKYEDKDRIAWNDFIQNSKNGNFLFLRKYMEYHADRFHDHSLMFFEDNELIAVMPANLSNNFLVSHEGLTYGGIVSNQKMKASLMLDIFEELRMYMLSIDVKKVIYKVIPHIYHSIPAEEDLYALFRYGAILFRRDVSSSIYLPEKLRLSKGRKSGISKGLKSGIQVLRSYDFCQFMKIEEEHLREKHGKAPVHTSVEISYLASLFPDNIKLFTANKEESMLGGVIVYESKQVAHAQYIAATEEGKQMSALDVVLDFLVNQYYRDKKYFDFGISTECGGTYLNKNLLKNKESFGARAIVYDFYELDFSKKCYLGD